MIAQGLISDVKLQKKSDYLQNEINYFSENCIKVFNNRPEDIPEGVGVGLRL